MFHPQQHTGFGNPYQAQHHQHHHHHHHTTHRPHKQHYLPPNVLVLFAPRPPLPFVAPMEPKVHAQYSGVANFIQYMEDPNVVPKPEPYEMPLTRLQKKELKEKIRKEKHEKELMEKLAQYNPKDVETATEDPYKTLFVARLSYTLTEDDLKREFEKYGAIKQIKLIRNNQTGKSRGYAFIEYEHTSDMKQAFKHADGLKLDGRRIKVDVERGRTVKNWRPRRLGGGLGESRTIQVVEPQEQEEPKPFRSYSSSHRTSSHSSSSSSSYHSSHSYHPYSRGGGSSGGGGGYRGGGGGGRYGDSGGGSYSSSSRSSGSYRR